MASGIKDKVAILGMGCSKFGERWDASPADLMVEAFEEGLADAGIDKTQIQMAWFGAGIDAFNVGSSAMPLSIALRLPNIPATKVENMCATGTEAFRGAVYAVASGACDIALALGVSDLIVGLTVVAIGTSLPELAASLAAARKGEHDIAIGNVIGSNIFNLVGVMALPGVIAPGLVDPSVMARDYPIMLALTVLLMLFAWGPKANREISRWEGGVLLTIYFAYLGYLIYLSV